MLSHKIWIKKPDPIVTGFVGTPHTVPKFKCQFDYDNFLVNEALYKMGQLLTWNCTPALMNNAQFASVILVIGVMDDYTDLEYRSYTGEPKYLHLSTVYSTNYSNPHVRYDDECGLRKLSPEELAWVKVNDKLQDNIKKYYPAFIHSD